MKTLLTLFVLFFSSSMFAEDISDFQIEGISIGDSLLDYFSEEEIKSQIKDHKYMYSFLSEEFGEVYLLNKLEIYEQLSFFVKPNDKDYKIYAIRGMIIEDDLNKCFSLKDLINQDISTIFKYAKKRDTEVSYRADPSGNSKGYQTQYSLMSGHNIIVNCALFEKTIKEKNNWINGLDVVIQHKEVTEWFDEN